MSGVDYFKKAAFENYSNFSGRARRSEFWFFNLFYILIIIGMAMLLGIAGGFLSQSSGVATLIMIPFFLIYIGMIIPSLAVSVRRLHDVGKSGWFLLIGIIPLIGSIVLLIFYCTDSQPDSNKWGHNPKDEIDGDDLADHLIEDMV